MPSNHNMRSTVANINPKIIILMRYILVGITLKSYVSFDAQCIIEITLLSAESQKNVSDIQLNSVENQKGAIIIDFVQQ